MIHLSSLRRPFLLAGTLLLIAIQVAVPDGLIRPLASMAGTSISFSPASVSLDFGGEAWVTILVNEVVNLYGADVRLAFNPAIVEVVDAIPGAPVSLQVGDMPYPDFVIKNEADNAAGTIWYAVTQLSPREPVSGSGILASVHIRGKGEGTTSLSFTNHDLVTREGLGIPNSASTCFIQVGSVWPTSTTTPTFSATATPSRTATTGPSLTPTVGPSATPTRTATVTRTRTPTLTSGPSYTPFPTSTPTRTPTVTNTPQPGATDLPTVTPSVTLTPAAHTFSGYVYEGGFGDTSRPLAGVEVYLYGSSVVGQPGSYLARSITNAQGHFEFSYSGSYPHYSLVEQDPVGYESKGAIPGSGGIVPDSSGNWVEYRYAATGGHDGTMFFDLPLSKATETSTPEPTETLTPASTLTATPTETVGKPSATPTSPGIPVSVSRRASRDTFLAKDPPDQNNGPLGYLALSLLSDGPFKNVLVGFDLQDIPSYAIVTEARLFLFHRDVYGSGRIPLRVYGLTRDWNELQATWHKASADELWEQGGAMGASDHDSVGVQGSFVDGAQADYYEWDVRSLVQEWISGARCNDGFLITPEGGTIAFIALSLYAHEYSEFALTPFLSFVYNLPPPTATPTLTETPTETATPTATATATPTPSVTRSASLFLPVILKPAL